MTQAPDEDDALRDEGPSGDGSAAPAPGAERGGAPRDQGTPASPAARVPEAEGDDPASPRAREAEGDDPAPPPGAGDAALGTRRSRRRWGPYAAVGLLWAALLGVIVVRSLLGPAAFESAPAGRSAPDPAAPAAAGAGRLDVVVVDGRGDPVAGATVRVVLRLPGAGLVGGTVATDGRGRARVLGLADGLAQVTVEHAGHARLIRTAPIAGGVGALRIELGLGATLAGRVVDTAGDPIAGAWVRVRPAHDHATPPWETATSAGGTFAFDTLHDVPLALEAGGDGLEPVGRRARAGDADVLVMLRRTGTLSGTVTDPRGAPAPHAAVVLAGSGVWPPRSATTGADGRYRFAGVPGGVYEVRASRGDEVAEPREGLLLAAGASATVDLRLGPGRVLRGRVVAAADARPLEGAEVLVAEDALAFAPVAVATGADGTFEVRGLRDRPHRVSVQAPGYLPIVGAAHPPGGEPITFALRRAATLLGRVVDERGFPVEGARVDVVGTGDGGEPVSLLAGEVVFRAALFHSQLAGPSPVAASGELGVTLGAVPPIPLGPGLAPEQGGASALLTNSAGEFTLTGVPPGDLSLVATHPEHAPGVGPALHVSAGSRHDGLELVLPRGGRVEARVVDGRGFAVPHVRVELHAEREPFPRFALADANGELTFEGALGRCTVTAHPEGQPPARETVAIQSGDRLSLTLALEGALHTLRLRALDDRRFPVPGARVSVRSLRARSPMQRVGLCAEDGTLEIGGLPPPPWRVAADHADYALTEQDLRDPPEGELSLVLRLGASVLGRVVDDASGEPVAGATVTLEAAGAAPFAARTDADGLFELSRVPAGNYTAIVTSYAHVEGRFPAPLLERRGELPTLDLEVLRLSPGGGVSGSVTDALGAAVPSAQVAAGERPDWSSASRADALGAFALQGLAAGTWPLWARHPAAGESAPLPIRVRPGELTPGVVLRLPERYDDERVASGPATQAGVAATVADRDGAVVVRAVPAGSAASRAGLRMGDVLVSVDDERVLDALHARGLLRGAVGVDAVVAVRRAGRSVRLVVPRERYAPE